MSLLRKKKKGEIVKKDFKASVLEDNIVPTTIFIRDEAVGFSVKERGAIFGNLKRGKPFNL